MLLGNAFIFLNKNSGFEYVKVSNVQQLYPADPDSGFVAKWSAYDNKRFSAKDLDIGYKILVDSLGIDTIKSSEKKISSISGWLFQTFAKQIGRPSLELVHPTVLKQYEYYVAKKDQQLWCGNFQEMVGFFCTAAKLQNRYIEIAPVNDKVNPPFHEVNEVYVPELKKWVMTDATRNLLLLKKNDQWLSAAEYYNTSLQHAPVAIESITFSDSSFANTSVISVQIKDDEYFNKDHFLRYYYTKDLAEVYTLKNKLKRYFLAAPWYEIYDPVRKHSTILFRVKQFFFLAAIVYCIFCIVFLFKKKPTEQ